MTGSGRRLIGSEGEEPSKSQRTGAPVMTRTQNPQEHLHPKLSRLWEGAMNANALLKASHLTAM